MSTTWFIHILIQQTTLHPTRRHLSYSAYYQLDFRGDLTASRNLFERGTTQYYCVLLPMLRNDFNTQHAATAIEGEDDMSLPWPLTGLTSRIHWGSSFCWESYPYVIQFRLLSRRLSAVTPSSLHGTKNACCQTSKQSRVLQANSERDYPSEHAEDIVACGWLT